MVLLERIEQQMEATGLPLFGITLAAVPCPDTPIILTLHWHGFVREKLLDIDEVQPVAYRTIPSSALQVNERWRDIVALSGVARKLTNDTVTISAGNPCGSLIDAPMPRRRAMPS